MRILDQLRKEALEKERKEIAQATIQQNLEANYQQIVLPKMQSIFAFMQELVEHLNFLEKAIAVTHYSDKYPQFGCLLQAGYKISTDGFGGLTDIQRLMQINVSFNCVGEGSFSWNVEGEARIEQAIEFLSSRKLKFSWKNIQDPQGLPAACFTIIKNIPVRFRFEVNYPRSSINLLINNHEDFGLYQKEFTPEALNEEFLDQIARFMLRIDNDLVKPEISLKHKILIQKSLEENKRQQADYLEQLRLNNIKQEMAQKNNLLKHIKSLVSLSKEL